MVHFLTEFSRGRNIRARLSFASQMHLGVPYKFLAIAVRGNAFRTLNSLIRLQMRPMGQAFREIFLPSGSLLAFRFHNSQ